MRILHTADWHLGRKLKGRDRTPEIAAQLQKMLDYARTEGIDAVLVAGDIFDSYNPSTDAEKAANNFFLGLHEARIPAVAIAGNHDSVAGLDEWGRLLCLAGVRVLASPRRADDGGVLTLDTNGGELCVAALPFISERRLLKSDDLWQQTGGEQLESYRDKIGRFMQLLAREFRDDRTNVMMAHVSIGGARLSSEREYETVGNYYLAGSDLPDTQYLALGHIHQRQEIKNTVAPAHYSGSLVQVDFGEAGEEKGFNVITVEPGGLAQVERVTLPCPKPLEEVICRDRDWEGELAAWGDRPGWLKVILELDDPVSDLVARVRAICPQALHVEARYRSQSQANEVRRIEAAKLRDRDGAVALFRDYYGGRFGEPPAALLGEFERLYQQAREESDATP